MDNTDVFESVFGRYGRVAVGIYLLLQYETAYKSSPELQPYVAAAFADLLEMVSSTAISCVEGFKSKESDQVIGRNVDAAFVTYAKRFSTHWNCVVDAHTAKLVQDSPLIYSSPELGSLRQFLGVQDRPLQFILDSRAHSLAEGSFEWFNNTLYDSVSEAPLPCWFLVVLARGRVHWPNGRSKDYSSRLNTIAGMLSRTPFVSLSVLIFR